MSRISCAAPIGDMHNCRKCVQAGPVGDTSADALRVLSKGCVLATVAQTLLAIDDGPACPRARRAALLLLLQTLLDGAESVDGTGTGNWLQGSAAREVGGALQTGTLSELAWLGSASLVDCWKASDVRKPHVLLSPPPTPLVCNLQLDSVSRSPLLHTGPVVDRRPGWGA